MNIYRLFRISHQMLIKQDETRRGSTVIMLSLHALAFIYDCLSNDSNSIHLEKDCCNF